MPQGLVLTVKCPRCGGGNTRMLFALPGKAEAWRCDDCGHTWTV